MIPRVTVGDFEPADDERSPVKTRVNDNLDACPLVAERDGPVRDGQRLAPLVAPRPVCRRVRQKVGRYH